MSQHGEQLQSTTVELLMYTPSRTILTENVVFLSISTTAAATISRGNVDLSYGKRDVYTARPNPGAVYIFKYSIF